jgi:ATP-dependent Lon protease
MSLNLQQDVCANKPPLVVRLSQKTKQSYQLVMSNAAMEDVAAELREAFNVTEQMIAESSKKTIFLCNQEKLSTRIQEEPAESFTRGIFAKLGEPKELARVTPKMLYELEKLVDEQPNFSLVIERIRTAMYLRALTRRPAQFAPILIYGPPGTGKTRFVRRLGEILGLYVNQITLAGGSDFAKISGSSRSWKSACVGDVVRGMADSKVANPLIVFDEIDKVCENQYGNPLDRILLLTETESARQFSDDFAEVPVDTSHASIIAMANEIEGLSAPLISRFELIPIAPLDEWGKRKMITTIYTELWQEECLAGLVAAQLDEPMVESLLKSKLSGRELKNSIRFALERACLSLSLDKARRGAIPIHVKVNHLQLPKPAVSHGIGFFR